jgi:hypothetical protein
MSQGYANCRIGIDLDNTLISYDRLFYEIAAARRLVPVEFVGTKRDIRDHVRRVPDGEVEWQRLQAEVYGPAIAGAAAAEGALDFVRQARRGGAQLSIVSHKTALATMGRETVNLRDAARFWLRNSGMLGPHGVDEEHLYFEETRADKIARIVSLECTHFIDDLEEVFNDPAFPAGVERLLLASAACVPSAPYRTFASFREVARAFSAD